MKQFSFALLLLCTAFVPVKAYEIYFETDFDKGITDEYTVWDKDENPTTGLSKIDFTTNGSWTSSQVERGDRAAMSSAYTTYDYEVEDWLILPSINIASDEAVLAWDALSVHYDFRECYKVMISDGELASHAFKEVYSVVDEEYFARRHAISLADYEGKDIYIAFVHTGKNKFVLAIDNIKVGVWNDDYALVNNTDVAGKIGDDVEVCGAIRNLSSDANINPILIVDGEEIPMYPAGDAPLCKTDAEQPFKFTIPVTEEGVLAYQLAVKNDSDEIVWSASDSIYCSAFAHNILVEELSGTWCNQCPAGIITMRKLEHRYRNRIVPVQVRVSDVMEDSLYGSSILYWSRNLPSIVYDRQISFVSQSAKDDGNIDDVMRMPVSAEVVPTVTYTEQGQLAIASTVRFAKEYDNSNDNYRIGYIITENVVNVDSVLYVQQNICQTAGNREFYYLPSYVPAKLMYYHNVVRGTSSAFNGVAHSLPGEALVAGVDYTVSDTIDIPASVIDKRNIAVIAVVIEVDKKLVLNSARVSTDEIDWSASVATVERAMANNRVVAYDGIVKVMDITDNATVQLYAIDGRTIGRASGSGQVIIASHNYQGVAIVAIETIYGTTYKKILIK